MSSEDELCTICLLPTTENSFRLKCTHKFHLKCINEFRSCRNSNWKICSLCRTELCSEDIFQLTSDEKKCEICSKVFNDQNPMYNLSCGHFFHFTCMITKNKNQRCFTCDQEYPEGLIKNADYNFKKKMGYL